MIRKESLATQTTVDELDAEASRTTGVAGRISTVLHRLELLLPLPWRTRNNLLGGGNPNAHTRGAVQLMVGGDGGAASAVLRLSEDDLPELLSSENHDNEPASTHEIASNLSRLLIACAHTLVLTELYTRVEQSSSASRIQLEGPMRMMVRACRARTQSGLDVQKVLKKLMILVLGCFPVALTSDSESTYASDSGAGPSTKPPREAATMAALDPFVVLFALLLLVPGDLSINDVTCALRFSYTLAIVQDPITFAKLTAAMNNHEDVAVLADAEVGVAKTTILLLRRAAVLFASLLRKGDLFLSSLRVYDSEKPSSLPISNASVVDEYRELVKLLHLPSLTTIFSANVSDALRRIIASASKNPAWRPNPSLRVQADCTYRSTLPIPLTLIKLPRLFQELLERFHLRMCSSCERVPQMPCLCLICGKLICAYGSCSPPKGSSSPSMRGHLGQCVAHAERCGAGTGVFLILKMTSVLVLRDERRAIWGSPYLDEHGEEDVELRRGKPLFLSKVRYGTLQRLWLTHGFDHDSRILASTARNGGFAML